MCIPRNKSSGVDGLTKEFQETSRENFPTPLYQVLGQHFILVSLANAILKLIKLKDNDKRFI